MGLFNYKTKFEELILFRSKMPDLKEKFDRQLKEALGEKIVELQMSHEEVTLVINADDLKESMLILRDSQGLEFSQLIDLCGVDYQIYKNRQNKGSRFAVVYHILSIKLNYRLRVRCFCSDNDFPLIESVTEIWPAASWFEREAFDLYGIHFSGHPDLRRLLTDYGFVGHPFRKDFPISGYVEMRYDSDQGRVVYEPVSIEPREVVPRVIREEKYGR